MHDKRFENAFQFLSGCFNQDWLYEFGDYETALAAGIEDLSLDRGAAVVRELRQILAEYSEPELDAVLAELQCCYSPEGDRGITNTDWLQEVIAELERSLIAEKAAMASARAKYPHAVRFFARYFYDDFREEFAGADAAVAAFIAGTDATTRAATMEELRQIVAEFPGSDQLSPGRDQFVNVFHWFGCDHNPEWPLHIPRKEWLKLDGLHRLNNPPPLSERRTRKAWLQEVITKIGQSLDTEKSQPKAQ